MGCNQMIIQTQTIINMLKELAEATNLNIDKELDEIYNFFLIYEKDKQGELNLEQLKKENEVLKEDEYLEYPFDTINSISINSTVPRKTSSILSEMSSNIDWIASVLLSTSATKETVSFFICSP
jgi:hypothetical protein